MKQKLVSVLILFLVLPLLLNPLSTTMEVVVENTITSNGNPDGIWTVMLYFCADTRNSEVTGIDNSGNFIDLELSLTRLGIINDLATGSGDDLNVLMLFDNPYSSNHPNGYAVIYEITSGVQTTVADWGATNMGDGQTLDNFVDYCKTNYPADYYALFLSDHGRGYAGICYDYHAIHPYFPYALGDCLELPEIETALSDGNEIDVLFLDCCLGSSFELAWQLADVVDYMMASETVGSGLVVHQPRDVLYALSRNTTMLPRDVAKLGYQAAVNPVLVPSGFDHWGSAVLLDLDLMSAPGSVGPGFMDSFITFTDYIIAEFAYNFSVTRNIFKDIRNNCTTWGLDTSSSMMVDLYNFLEQVVAFNQTLHFIDTSLQAELLINWLTPGENNIIISEFYWWEEFTHLNGLSICLPDTYDMYQGYLWPNMYENLKLSQETYWWDIIDGMFPTYNFDQFRLPDCYHIFIHPLDPVSQLHIYFGEDVLPDPLHVGLNKVFYDEPGMGIELGIAGAEYHQDLLWGNTMIYIPTQSLQIGYGSKAVGDNSFKVLVKTGATTDAQRIVNLTVKHIVNDEILWEENQIKEVDPGTVVSCEISTNDTMSDIIIEETPTTNPLGSTSIDAEITTVVVFLSIGFIAAIANRRRRKKH